MRDKITEQYDSWYTNHETVFGQEPNPLVKTFATYVPAGIVLDVGGGEGRNALYLARQGVPVEVTDLSAVGLSKVQALADEHELSLTTHQSDVIEEGISGEYAGMLFVMVLHHMPAKDVARMIQQAKEATLPQGVHVIETFANSGELYERNEIKGRFYPDEAQLAALYHDWEVIKLETYQGTSFARNKDGSQMTNHIITLLARKPVQ